MKALTKILGAAVLAGGAMLAVATPASAQVSFGIGIGPAYGGYYGGYPAYSCDTWSGLYNPYRCGYPAYPAYPYYSRSYWGPAYGYYRYPRGYAYRGGYGYRGGYRGGRGWRR